MNINTKASSSTIIKNATIVNEHSQIQADIRICGQHIDKIAASIAASNHDEVVDA